MTEAICFAASSGHLFQTAVGALQARRHSANDVQVIVTHVAPGPGSDEARVFSAALAARGVSLIHLSESALRGRHVTFARYYLDEVTGSDIDHILYLDGDTQVLGNLGPLLASAQRVTNVAAARDPMVLLHQTSPLHRRMINRWWQRGGIEGRIRSRYANSGVLLFRRGMMASLRERMLHSVDCYPRARFADQDALNRATSDEVQTVSMRWNFPGFMLGTGLEHAVGGPRIVHFMSDPRPWAADFKPWGAQYFKPYQVLARLEPDLAPYWQQSGAAVRWRYGMQQAAKALTERRHLKLSGTREALLAQESDLDLREPDD